MLEVLTGVPLPDDLPGKSCLLYRCLNKVQFVEHMPSFDEWGLRPVGLVGPRENPIFVAPLLIDPTARTPDVDAGGERHRVPLGRLLGSGCCQVLPMCLLLRFWRVS